MVSFIPLFQKQFIGTMFALEIPTVTSTPSTLTCGEDSRYTTTTTMAVFQPSHKPLTRTLSEGELSAYSSVNSVRDTMASARRTRESLRKSRASIRALRDEADKTLREIQELRREMKQYQMNNCTTELSMHPATYESDQESDSGVLSHPTVHSGISDMTIEF